jgi:hypothetical protein
MVATEIGGKPKTSHDDIDLCLIHRASDNVFVGIAMPDGSASQVVVQT